MARAWYLTQGGPPIDSSLPAGSTPTTLDGTTATPSVEATTTTASATTTTTTTSAGTSTTTTVDDNVATRLDSVQGTTALVVIGIVVVIIGVVIAVGRYWLTGAAAAGFERRTERKRVKQHKDDKDKDGLLNRPGFVGGS